MLTPHIRPPYLHRPGRHKVYKKINLKSSSPSGSSSGISLPKSIGMNQSEINSSILLLRIFTITRHKQSDTAYTLHYTIKNNSFISTLKCSNALVAFKKSFIQPLYNLHVKPHLWKWSSLRIQGLLQDFFRIRVFIKCRKVKNTLSLSLLHSMPSSAIIILSYFNISL